MWENGGLSFISNQLYLWEIFLKYLSDIVHRDLKLENILLGQPAGNELLNIKVGSRNVTMYLKLWHLV